MMWKRVPFWVWLVASFVFGLVAIADAFRIFPAYDQICEAAHGTEKQCASYSILPFFMIQIAHGIESHSDLVIAIATIAIAAFTYTLWNATMDQGRLTQQSNDLGAACRG